MFIFGNSWLNSQSQPLVTIGIPLYNEEKYIEEALRSAAAQCATVWISDNASTDGSAAICEMLSREYPNVHFVRQSHNMGSIANFKFLLDKADTPFFMWLGGHDALPDGYVRQLTQLLQYCPGAVLAYGASRHVDVDGGTVSNYNYNYSATLADNLPIKRILGLIRYLSDCSLIHGVFRSEALRAAWNAFGADSYLGADHVLLTHAATEGSFVYAPETYLIRRDVHPADTPQQQVKRMDSQQLGIMQVTCREMQRRQYALAAAVAKGTAFPGFLFRLNARYYLVERFGEFSESILIQKFELLLKYILRWIGKLLRLIRRKTI